MVQFKKYSSVKIIKPLFMVFLSLKQATSGNKGVCLTRKIERGNDVPSCWVFDLHLKIASIIKAYSSM